MLIGSDVKAITNMVALWKLSVCEHVNTSSRNPTVKSTMEIVYFNLIKLNLFLNENRYS